MQTTIGGKFERLLGGELREAKLIDLSHTLEEGLPSAFPSAPQFQRKVLNWYAPVEEGPQPVRSTAPWMSAWMVIGEHMGTHCDAPPHFIPPADSGLPHAGPTGEMYGAGLPLEMLQGPAVVIDIAGMADTAATPGESPLIEPDVVSEWERNHRPIKPGDVVLLRTGWDEYYRPFPEGAAYIEDPWVRRTSAGWPAPSAACVDFLGKRGVELLGTDAPSIGAVDDMASMHYAGLERGMLFIEQLARLNELPSQGAYFIFLPLKIARAGGCPGRAIAFVFTEEGAR